MRSADGSADGQGMAVDFIGSDELDVPELLAIRG